MDQSHLGDDTIAFHEVDVMLKGRAPLRGPLVGHSAPQGTTAGSDEAYPPSVWRAMPQARIVRLLRCARNDTQPILCY